jgi:hypothetical protein
MTAGMSRGCARSEQTEEEKCMSHTHRTSSTDEGVQVIRQPATTGAPTAEAPGTPPPAWSRSGYEPERTYDRELVPTRAGSRVRGGPVWAGFAVALATWLLLQLVVIALTLGDLTSSIAGGGSSSGLWWSGVAAVVALFVGGLVAGAASEWDGVSDGILQGVVVWSMVVVSLILLSAIGAGIGFGVVGDLLNTVHGIGAGQVDSSVTSTAQDAAAGAVLALGVTVVAAGLGGAAGAKLWRPETRIR